MKSIHIFRIQGTSRRIKYFSLIHYEPFLIPKVVMKIIEKIISYQNRRLFFVYLVGFYFGHNFDFSPLPFFRFLFVMCGSKSKWMKAKAEPDKPLVYELEVVRLPPWWLLPLKPENKRPRGTFYNNIPATITSVSIFMIKSKKKIAALVFLQHC